MTPPNVNHPSWGGKRQPRQGKAIGRPRMHPSGLSRFYINLSPDDLAWLEEQAGEMGTRAGVVRRLIDEARQAEADPDTGPAGQQNWLARVLLEEFGGPVEGDKGAAGMAIRLLRLQRMEIDRLRAALDYVQAWLPAVLGSGAVYDKVKVRVNDALAGQSPTPAVNWRRIETALTDGRSLLLWSPDLGYHAGRWDGKMWTTLTGFSAGAPLYWLPLLNPPAAPEPAETSTT